METCRKLNVTFEQEGHVRYWFDRDRPLKRYLIEYPDDRVEILRDTTPGYVRGVENGDCRLTWENPPAEGRSFVVYRKVNMLAPVGADGCRRYREEIRIKASDGDHFHLWLGGVGPFSAVGARSTAVFTPVDDPRAATYYRPGQLSDTRFHRSGILRIHWELEPWPPTKTAVPRP